MIPCQWHLQTERESSEQLALHQRYSNTTDVNGGKRESSIFTHKRTSEYVNCRIFGLIIIRPGFGMCNVGLLSFSEEELGLKTKKQLWQKCHSTGSVCLSPITFNHRCGRLISSIINKYFTLHWNSLNIKTRTLRLTDGFDQCSPFMQTHYK